MVGGGLLAGLFAGLPVVTREADPGVLGPVARCFPEEHAVVQRAVDKRRFEYFASRHLARQAFVELGVEPKAVLTNADRSPCWPAEVIGSISHTTGWCGVALAKRGSGLSGLGIDGERHATMSDGVVERVLTAGELGANDNFSQAGAILRFSAKEAFYKAVYPFVRRYIAFQEVEVWPDPMSATFEVRPISQELIGELHRLPTLHGRYRQTAEICVTAVLVMP